MKYMGDTLGTVHSITNEISKQLKFKLGPWDSQSSSLQTK